MRRPEEAGFRDYVTARMDVLRRTAYLLCRDWHLADDLVSITIGKLYRHWPRARRMDHVDAYVRRILVRTWLDEKARAWRREEPAETLPELVVPPSDDVVERLGLLELLDVLPPRRRAAVVLRYYCDLSVEETAEILECSPGTVKSQTARGLDSLRALVAASQS
ncbi:RNA polymerase sigma24 factor [Amycolatopsis sp. NBRC 101858]|uniref:SigE family RNA polymerase sigma factor n=1 Tax=Amycolatopsis sp. NBRC 101858 TaxID=3032200 RepID=UPI0024A3EB65|nr:SigE family RNA polymerase sigma factor [Amycolatopsis sp. NBRC 101858]GLY43597.1 RNA polymerase sigma24 factor [Amycolatopsis sp. NBRC 101858]